MLLKTYSKIDSTKNLELARGCTYFGNNAEVNHRILQKNFNKTEYIYYATHQSLLRMPKFLV
jgi:hypothetical protein